MASDLVEILPNGTPRLHMHPGQWRAWQSLKRFVWIFAGTQSGKTSYEPWWLSREIDQCGGGDYLAITSTYDLFQLKFLPTLREVFEHHLRRGRYWSSNRVIEICDPKTGKFLANKADDPMWARIILRSAESDSGLESSTVKAAIMDECGMDSYKIGTWEAVQRRLSLSQGRVLGGTTLYDLGWLKEAVYDKWIEAGGNHPEHDIIQFDSTENPTFPKEEFERQRKEMPPWKFAMMYQGQYERPAGLIYDCFKNALAPEGQVVKPFALPDTWSRYGGLDFGGVNTFAVLIAYDQPSDRYYVFDEYHDGGKTAKEHTDSILAKSKNSKGETVRPIFIGGSHSEGQWRLEFNRAGLPIAEPAIKDVEVGINRTYGLFKTNKLYIFDNCKKLIGMLQSYARELDATGQPTEKIKDKAASHACDALRYIASRLTQGQGRGA